MRKYIEQRNEENEDQASKQGRRRRRRGQSQDQMTVSDVSSISNNRGYNNKNGGSNSPVRISRTSLSPTKINSKSPGHRSWSRLSAVHILQNAGSKGQFRDSTVKQSQEQLTLISQYSKFSSVQRLKRNSYLRASQDSQDDLRHLLQTKQITSAASKLLKTNMSCETRQKKDARFRGHLTDYQIAA